MLHELIARRWTGAAIVAAPGPSLTEAAAELCRELPVLAVGDAWRRVPWAEALYHTDAAWWQHCRQGSFAGGLWSSHSSSSSILDDKRELEELLGLDLVRGEDGEGFRLDGRGIHYGDCSGFAAVNLALQMGATTVVLVGFDMQTVDGRCHFFGDYPPGLRQPARYESFVPRFEEAARMLPPDRKILNATPRSALRCFPSIEFDGCGFCCNPHAPAAGVRFGG